MALSASERSDIASYAASVRWSRLGAQERAQATLEARRGRYAAVRARVIAEAEARGETLTPRDLKLRTQSAWKASMASMRRARRRKAAEA